MHASKAWCMMCPFIDGVNWTLIHDLLLVAAMVTHCNDILLVHVQHYIMRKCPTAAVTYNVHYSDYTKLI